MSFSASVLGTRCRLGEGIGFLDKADERLNALLGPEDGWERDGRRYLAEDVAVRGV